MVVETTPAPGQAVIDPNATPAAQAGATPASGAQPGEAGAQPENEQKMVPLAALHEERDRVKALRDEVDAMKTTMVSQMQYPQTPQQQPQDMGYPQPTAANPVATQMDQLWQSDPKRAVQTEISMALNWYDNTNAQLDVQEEQIAQKHTDFTTYRNEVRRYLRTLPPQQRSKPGVVELAYYVVRGQKTDTLVEQSNQALIDKIKAGEQVQGFTGTVSSPAVPLKPVQLNQDQKNAAMAMGMTDEDYIKNVK